MSNKLYVVLLALFCNFVAISNAFSYINAYDNETGYVVELLNLEYGEYDFNIGQAIEYFDLETYKRSYAIITDIENNFSSIILTITDNETQKTRKITIYTEN